MPYGKGYKKKSMKKPFKGGPSLEKSAKSNFKAAFSTKKKRSNMISRAVGK